MLSPYIYQITNMRGVGTTDRPFFPLQRVVHGSGGGYSGCGVRFPTAGRCFCAAPPRDRSGGARRLHRQTPTRRAQKELRRNQTLRENGISKSVP